MSFSDALLRSGSLVAIDNGYRLRIGLPWMRNLPMSSVRRLEFVLDDRSSDDGDVRVHVDGQRVTVSDLAEFWDRVWPVQEDVVVDVTGAGTLVPGRSHHVRARADLALPYIVTPAGPVVMSSHVERRLTARSG